MCAGCLKSAGCLGPHCAVLRRPCWGGGIHTRCSLAPRSPASTHSALQVRSALGRGFLWRPSANPLWQVGLHGAAIRHRSPRQRRHDRVRCVCCGCTLCARLVGVQFCSRHRSPRQRRRDRVRCVCCGCTLCSKRVCLGSRQSAAVMEVCAVMARCDACHAAFAHALRLPMHHTCLSHQPLRCATPAPH